jgi:photosystem II stability/assembly factor-like uncharacterized protein
LYYSTLPQKDKDMKIFTSLLTVICLTTNIFGQIQFATHNIVTNASGACSVYAVDIDGDDAIDVLSAFNDVDIIVWYENDGNENFSSHIITTDADGARAVYAVDVDGDGDSDVLSASNVDNKIAWYENDGNENFTSHTITTNAISATSIFALDLDGDTDIDVLSASQGDHKIAWYENDGNENFTSHTITTSAFVAFSVYATDVDDDGDVDVLSASVADNKIAWYENDGNENFTSHTITNNANTAYSVYALDVDGDGDVDVLSASNGDNKIAWYENDGNENFTSHTITTSAIYASSVFASDLDGDTDIDILSASYSNSGVAWYENDGNENFTSHNIINTPSGALSVYATDVDGDGYIDMLSASGDKVTWYENLGPITVTSPNGGEEWSVGSTRAITWTSSFVTNVKIEYTTDGGSNWITIINSTPSSGTYIWTIPNTPSNICKVKITDVSNPTTFDESDNPFSIVQTTIIVTSPNGGESWLIGSVHNITWNSSYVSSVKIEYSTDLGNSWITVINLTPSDGIYAWTIPNTPSSNCLVKVTDWTNPMTYDESDNPFSITSSITIFYPNGGETLEGTTTETISFISSGVDSVMVQYSSDAGTSWELVYSSMPASGNINWVIPNITSVNCLIKVTSIEDINVFDESDNEFSITEVGWFQQNSNVGANLYSIDMLNTSVGYSSGDNGTIIKTTDSGFSWEVLPTGIIEDLISIKFVSESIGWVVGNNGKILKTTNGGLSWTYQSSNTTNALNSVYLISQNVGWAVGNNGTILKTTDSGNNWITQQSNVTTSLNSVFFYSAYLGWISGNSGTYLKTTNGGDTWVQKTTGTTYNLNSVLFTSNIRGFIVGDNGTILSSEDAGEIWTIVFSGSDNFNSIYFADGETGFVVGDNGRIYKSIDSGLGWFRIGSGLQNNNDLYDVAFADSITGWAVGQTGKIIKTITGGSGYAATILIANALSSSQILEVSSNEGFYIDDNIMINPGGVNQEINKIVGFGSFLLESPLLYDHQIGELVINLKPTSVEEEFIHEIPKEYTLLNNYPNPFNPITTIRYDIPERSAVLLKVYDVLGSEIATLVNEEKQSGEYEIEFNAINLPSGIYIYQLKAGDFIETKKMVLMK